jgi:hypothetical protein
MGHAVTPGANRNLGGSRPPQVPQASAVSVASQRSQACSLASMAGIFFREGDAVDIPVLFFV